MTDAFRMDLRYGQCQLFQYFLYGDMVHLFEHEFFETGIVTILHDEVGEFFAFVNVEMVNFDDLGYIVKQSIIMECLRNGIDDFWIPSFNDFGCVDVFIVFLLLRTKFFS